MPRFVPPVQLKDIAYDSERVVYEALAQLSGDYVVLHSFPWLRPNRDLVESPLCEGEADFVILHADRGLLVLEVKGGTPVLENRQWTRAGKPMRDPFEQARRSRYALLEAIEERTNHRINRRQFAHGDVVVFPHACYDGPLPLNTDARIIVDACGVRDISTRLDYAFKAWARTRAHLSRSQFAELLDALMPKMRLLRCASVDIASERSRIIQISLDQRATLLGLLANERVLVEGTAGSGKTLLALEFAMTLASRGLRVLLLCYNRHLATWLAEQVIADSRCDRVATVPEIATFHSYAFSLAKRAEVDFEVPSQGDQAFWDDEIPLILEQAIQVLANTGQAPAFDAVIVDESQDFAPDWWVTVESLTKNGRLGRLYAFIDLKQSLRGDVGRPPVPFQAEFALTTNCRNTRAIALSSAQIAEIKTAVLPGTPDGECPVARRSPSSEVESEIVIGEVKQLLKQGLEARQIALIGPAAHKNGLLSGVTEIAGEALIDDTTAWRRGGGLLVTTARAFKGLEAEVVIMYGLRNFGTLFTRTDLYVAWTRACHRLILICENGEVKTEIEAALAAVERLPAHAIDA